MFYKTKNTFYKNSLKALSVFFISNVHCQPVKFNSISFVPQNYIDQFGAFFKCLLKLSFIHFAKFKSREILIVNKRNCVLPINNSAYLILFPIKLVLCHVWWGNGGGFIRLKLLFETRTHDLFIITHW